MARAPGRARRLPRLHRLHRAGGRGHFRRRLHRALAGRGRGDPGTDDPWRGCDLLADPARGDAGGAGRARCPGKRRGRREPAGDGRVAGGRGPHRGQGRRRELSDPRHAGHRSRRAPPRPAGPAQRRLGRHRRFRAVRAARPQARRPDHDRRRHVRVARPPRLRARQDRERDRLRAAPDHVAGGAAGERAPAAREPRALELPPLAAARPGFGREPDEGARRGGASRASPATSCASRNS